jgi:hypothetical protein
VAATKHSHLIAEFRSEAATLKNLVSDVIDRSDAPHYKNIAHMTLRRLDGFVEMLLTIIEEMEGRIDALERK